MIAMCLYILLVPSHWIRCCVEEMDRTFVFADVQCRGHYPSYILKEWERFGTEIKMEPEDLKIIKEGQVDIYCLLFST